MTRSRRLARTAAGCLAMLLPVAALAVTPSAQAAPDDAGRLVFTRGNQVYTSTTSGGSVTKLTSTDKNYRPRWSPDGKRIAFIHETASGARDIWVMSASGRSKHQVTHVGDASQPAWSPDGKRFAFGSASHVAEGTDDGKSLMTIRTSAPYGSPTVLPMVGFPSYDSPSGELDPPVGPSVDWSPDGRSMVYDSYFSTFRAQTDETWSIIVYDVASHRARFVAGGCGSGESGCVGAVHDPSWFPDSRSLAITSTIFHDGFPPENNAKHVEFFDLSAAPAPSFPRVEGDSDPDISPSGSRVVFTHYSRVYTANVDGSDRRRVTTGYNPDWQPVP